MSATNFGLSWIGDELQVCRLQHDDIAQNWTASAPIRELGDLHRALVTASAELGLHRGGTLAIAYQSDQQLHRFLELPPLSPRDLDRHLARRAAQESTFGGDIAFSYNRLDSPSFGSGALLHLLPKSLLDAIIRIAGNNHLTPLRLVPITDILLHRIAALALPETEVVLGVALFAGRVELVAATGRGEALFVRSLQFDWSGDGGERLRLDIERTVLYLKQRQQIVARIVVAGRGALAAMEAMRAAFTLPVEQLPQGAEPWFWAWAASRTPIATTSNLVPQHVRNSLRTRRILHGSSWVAAAAVLAALAITATVEFLRWQQRETDPGWSARYLALRQQRDEYARRAGSVRELHDRLERLVPARGDLPAQFLARLGDIVPASATLHRAEISWEQDRWRVHMEGEAQATMIETIALLEAIQHAIEEGPWRGQVSDSWRADWLERLRQGGATAPGPIGFRVDATL